MIKTLEKNPQVKRKITKAKLSKNGGLEVEWEQSITIEREGLEPYNINSNDGSKREPIPHQDLINAFSLLRSHLALICELPEAKGKDLYQLDDDTEALQRIKVNSISIGGSGESEGVSISGFKTLKGGKILNLNAPFTKYIDETGEGYEYGDQLNHLITHLTDEVELYLDGKIAPDAQQSLEFPESDADDKDDIE